MKKKSKSEISQCSFLPKNRKGLSAVVTTMILVLLVMSSAAIIFSIVNNTVEDKLGTAESCNKVFDKVTLNSRFTCYNFASEEVQFSVNIGDVELDKIIVSVGSELDSKTFTLDNTSKEISGLKNYDGSSLVKMPNRNAGDTYVASGFSVLPNKIEVAPHINDNLCSVSDSISNIGEC